MARPAEDHRGEGPCPVGANQSLTSCRGSNKEDSSMLDESSDRMQPDESAFDEDPNTDYEAIEKERQRAKMEMYL